MQRARVLAYMLEDTNLYASEAGLKAGFTSTVTTPVWVHRFNEKELAGLEDQPRKGRKPTHGAEVHSQLVSLATQKPKTLGYPFELWTLERLQTAFLERHGIHLSDSTIWEWLAAEGLEWKLQQSWFHAAEKHDPEFVEKKGSIIAAYMTCVPRTRVICVDEMGPIAVKTYPGEAWLMGPNRATFEPAYGRRDKLWVRGGFESATGQAAILMSPGRDSTSHIQLLEKIFVQFPADRWLIIEDNLSIHISGQVKLALTAWPEVQILFIPKYACWLNLIEPWWKQLRSLALKGKRFENLDELISALNQSLEYWNAHRHPYIWKKKPQEQLTLFGGYSVCKGAVNSIN